MNSARQHRGSLGLIVSAALISVWATAHSPAIIAQDDSLLPEAGTDLSDPPERLESPDVAAPGIIISRTVTAEAGDSLADIAERELGRRGLVGVLADFNNLATDAALTAGTTIQVPIVVPDRGESASVVFVKGGVSRNGTTLTADDLVAPGDVIETTDTGFVSLEFSNGSTVNIHPETIAVVQELRCLDNDELCIIGIETEAGQLRSDVESRDGQELEYRITTPIASAAVRGTDFNVQADGAELLVAVTEGGVNVGAEGENVGLDEGFGSVTLEGEPPGQPIALLPPPAFRTVPNRFVAGQSVLWWELRQVDRYTASIAGDSVGREVVSEVETADSSLAISALGDIDAGDYFLSVRGIDENGLPGFVASKRIIVATVDNALPPPQIDASREGNDVVVAVVNPAPQARGYEIQLADSADFADPLSVDVGPAGSAVFRFDADQVFARARQLQDPITVSEFSPSAEAR